MSCFAHTGRFMMLLAAWWAASQAARADEAVVVDAGEVVGLIPAIHGVNNGPLVRLEWEPVCPLDQAGDYTERFLEAHIPQSRTHGEGPFDINEIWRPFPRFAGFDPDDPALYDWTITDERMAATAGVTDVLVRLGNGSGVCDPNLALPPDDFGVWARVARNILRHYLRGWADGFYYDNIRYVEIWNEFYEPNYWLGTPTEAAQLYAAAYAEIKDEFGDQIMVAGSMSRGPKSYEYFTYLRDHGVGVDFIADHMYPERPREFIEQVYLGSGAHPELTNWEAYLPLVGYPADTPIMFTEWNRTLYRWGNDVAMASFAAATLITLADLHPANSSHNVLMGHYFSARKQMYNADGSFRHPGQVFYTYGALMYGRTPLRLAASGTRHDPEGYGSDFLVLAGRSRDSRLVQVMLAHYGNSASDPWPSGPGPAFNLALTIDNLPWGSGGGYSWQRWSHDRNLRGLYLSESGQGSGQQFVYTGQMSERSNCVFIIKGVFRPAAPPAPR